MAGKKTVLSDIEAMLNEPSDSGFNVILMIFNSLQELSKDPGSLAVRTLVRQTEKPLQNILTVCQVILKSCKMI